MRSDDPQLQSFLVGGGTSSTATDCQRARQPPLRVSITRAIPYILLLGPYTSVYCVYVIMTSWLVGWFTGQGKKGVCDGKKVNCGPVPVCCTP